MKNLLILTTMLLTFGFVYAQKSEQVNIMTLNGTWDLYENSSGKIGETSDQSMKIMTFDGNKIVVQGISPGPTYWIGLGELRGSEGYFDWRFDDGRYGQTTFKVDKNGNLDARSMTFMMVYKYLAKKRN